MQSEIVEGMAVSVEDMISELEEYYECAGFADFYERVLKDMSEEQIRKYYDDTFHNIPDHELEMWECQKNE